MSTPQQIREKYSRPRDAARGITAPTAGADGAAPEVTKTTQQGDAAAQLAQIGAEVGHVVLADEIKALNAEYFVSVENGKVSVYREGVDPEMRVGKLDAMPQEQFKLLLSNRTVHVVDGNGNSKVANLADVWLRSPERRQYLNGIALLPGEEAPEGVYNLWRGFGVEPAEATEEMLKPPLWHLKYVICGGNEVLYRYVVGWMAYCVQHPDKPAEVAIVMRGGQGTGKSTVGRWMRDIFGQHGVHVLHSRHLVGNHNAHLRGACFLFADEAFFAGDRQAADVLKGLVTEPTMMVEPKFVGAYTVPNRLKIMMASNSEWVIPAGADERRYLVLDVSDIKKGDEEYFNGLYAHMKAGGLAALLGYLLSLSVSKFNVRKAPTTQALVDQKLLSMPPFQRWLYERLHLGCMFDVEPGWQTKQPRTGVANAYQEYVRREGIRHERTDAATVGRNLRKLFPDLGEVRQGARYGTRDRCWVLPELYEARRLFEAAALGGASAPWPADV